jgi:hypothetical protein
LINYTKFKSSAQFVIAQKGHLLKKNKVTPGDAKRLFFGLVLLARQTAERAWRDCIE